MLLTGARDSGGRLRVPFFVGLMRDYVERGVAYEPAEFKRYVEQRELLSAADWDAEGNGYAKWKHRVDRAAQKIFTDV
jgi:hypothetical protein